MIASGVGDPGVGVGLVDLLAAQRLDLNDEQAERDDGAAFLALVQVIEGLAQRLGQDLLDPGLETRRLDRGDQILDRRRRAAAEHHIAGAGTVTAVRVGTDRRR